MRIPSALLALPAALSLAALPNIASAESPDSESPGVNERLRGEVIWMDSSLSDISSYGSHTSKTIYLNRCVGGCVISPGPNNSRANTSRIVNSTSFITEFSHGDETWEELVLCLREVYEPFDIIITDVDPGQASHFEAIVAGVDDDINYPGVDGLAPGGCGITNNAITFSFANQMNTVDRMCWTVAQETAHAFGLDHELNCADPMTYLTNCSPAKTFQNESANCGEDVARSCNCTASSTQNSYSILRSHFGAGPLSPPDVEIVRPDNGSEVRSNFPIEVDATDNIRVASVEFAINGQVVNTLTSPPYVINAPDGLTGGVTVQVRATDNLGTSSEVVSYDVTINNPDPLAEFGTSCQANEECDSNLCAISENGGFCTTICDLAADTDTCPDDSTCTEAGTSAVCWVSGKTSTGGCQSGGSSSALGGLFLLGLLGVLRFGIFRKRYGQQ